MKKVIDEFISIGGCHNDGYGIEGSPSFVDIIESDSNIKCVYKKSYFQFKKIDLLESILKEHETSIVLLQLGNYEFPPSLKVGSSSSKSNSKSVKSKTISDFYQGRNWMYRLLLDTSKSFLTPFYWYIIKKRNKVYFEKLKQIIMENKNKVFVLISPLPCYKTSNNIMRRIGTIFYKNNFIYDNVIFVNSHKIIPSKKEMFVNQIHLSAKGHRVLGTEISKILQDSLKNN